MLDKSDSLAVVLLFISLGIGTYLQTLRPKTAKTFGVLFIAAGVIGASLWVGHYRGVESQAAESKPECSTAGIVDHGQNNEFYGDTIKGLDCGIEARGTGGHYEFNKIEGR